MTPPTSASAAWAAYLDARIAYEKAPGDDARRRVQLAYLALCTAMDMSGADTADCMAMLAARNGWPALEREVAA